MPDIFSSVTAAPTPTGSVATEAPVVRLTVSPEVARQLQPYAGQGITLVVKQLLPGDLAVLALPNGQTITAQAPRTPLQLGAQLQAQLPSAAQLAATTSNVTLALLARLLPAARTTAPQAAVTQALAQQASATLTLTNLEVLVKQSSVLAATPQPASAQPVPTLLLPGPVTVQAAPLPQALQVPGQPTALPAGPTVVQITALPPAPGQPQAAMLYPIPPANQPLPATAPTPVPVMVRAGQALPVGVELPLVIPANAAQARPVTVQIPTPVQLTPQPVVLPTPQSAQAFTEATVTLPQPLTATASVIARVITPPQPLPVVPGQPPLVSQQVLLPTLPGQPTLASPTVTLTTPQPLPLGTVLTLLPNLATPTQPMLQSVTSPPVAIPAQPLPATPLAALPPLPVGQPLQAVVTQVLPQQLKIDIALPSPTPGQAPVASTVVNSPTPLPPGTALAVVLNNKSQLVVQNLTPPAGLDVQQTLGRFETQWPQLAHATAQLARQSPGVLAQLAERLPHVAALTPGLASYVDALQHQNPTKWLGNEVVTMLRALGVDLTQDLSQLAVLRQPHADGWQGVIFPYLENPQGQPQQGRFFWKHSQPEEEQQSSGNTRFVVEMALSQLGEIQLDGLLNYPELWLKLRLHPPVNTTFGTDLQSVVQTMLQGFGLQGGLSVESLGTFPIDAARLVTSPAEPTVATAL